MNLKKITTPTIDFFYIDTYDSLDYLMSLFQKQQLSLLAVDTETYIDISKFSPSALDPHSSLLSLLQLSDGINVYLISTVELNNIIHPAILRLIHEVFLNEEVKKVMHFAQFDLQQIKSFFGVWMKNVCCTFNLSKSLGIVNGFKFSNLKGHSLKDLSRDFYDIHLDKQEAISQWGIRPLSTSQLIYAALDVGVSKQNKHLLHNDTHSLLLDLYFILTQALEDNDQHFCYTTDQLGMIVSARLEYSGVSVDKFIIEKVKEEADRITNENRNFLVSSLGFNVYEELVFNDDGEWELEIIIPDKVKKTLNNNTSLVAIVNTYLENNYGSSLDSLQADEIKTYLDSLQKSVEDDDSSSSSLSSLFDDDYDEIIEGKYENIKLISALLKYKRFSKLSSECSKYLTTINPNTHNIHPSFYSTGAATGRMSSSGAINLQQVSNINVTIDLP